MLRIKLDDVQANVFAIEIQNLPSVFWGGLTNCPENKISPLNIIWIFCCQYLLRLD